MIRLPLSAWRLLLLALGLLAGTPALACDVVTPTSASAGSLSSPALQANATFVRTDGSFVCASGSLASLLGADYLKVTLASALVLTGTGGSVPATLAVDMDGAQVLTPGTTVTYQEGALLTLLQSGGMRAPLYVRAQSTGDLPAGTYSGTATIRWDWSFCAKSGVGLAGLCLLGKRETGSKPAQVTFTVTVLPKPAAVTITTTTTWSPLSQTANPKSVPGAKVRVAATITNPDVVPLDQDTLAVVVATPPAMRLALDGDGTAANGVVETRQGSPASGLTLSYAAPGSPADDVDFSADGGATWTYAPLAGDAVSQGAVTAVRFRPRGRMAAGSSFAMSLPYVVK